MSTVLVRFALLACVATQASALFIGAKSVSQADVASANSTPSVSATTAASSTSIVTETTPAPKPAVAATAGVSPLGSGSDVFNAGGICRASWIPDTSGASTWKSMTIDLMTGSNLQMTKLGTVATNIDGTNVNVTAFNYSCPQVTPNAAIYFLQYTHGTEQDPTWTTRFTIADASGKYVPPPNSNQPQGGSPAIPWGQGALVLADTTTSANTTSSTPTATRAANNAAVTGNARQSQLADTFSSYQSSNSKSSSNANAASNSFAASSLVVSISVVAVLAATSL